MTLVKAPSEFPQIPTEWQFHLHSRKSSLFHALEKITWVALAAIGSLGLYAAFTGVVLSSTASWVAVGMILIGSLLGSLLGSIRNKVKNQDKITLEAKEILELYEESKKKLTPEKLKLYLTKYNLTIEDLKKRFPLIVISGYFQAKADTASQNLMSQTSRPLHPLLVTVQDKLLREELYIPLFRAALAKQKIRDPESPIKLDRIGYFSNDPPSYFCFHDPAIPPISLEQIQKNLNPEKIRQLLFKKAP